MNLIRTASLEMYPSGAIRHIARALEIEDFQLAVDMMPTDAEWRRMDDAQRLVRIGQWLNAEAHAAADRSQRMTIGADPMHTVGTRD